MNSSHKRILDAYPDAIMVFGEDLRLVYANRQAEKLAQQSAEDLAGTSYQNLFPDAPRLGETLLQYMPGGIVLDSGEWNFKRGSEFTSVSLRLVILDLESSEGGAAKRARGLLASFVRIDNHVRIDLPVMPDLNSFGLITKGNSLLHIQATVYDIAQSNANVLITGETGTGKELLANVIHGLSPRKSGPLIKINCAAIPENLLEAELFGYKKGAFTDARSDKPGRFQMARDGTLVLDEIGDMPLPLQVKLLRVIETQQVDPLGGVKPEMVNARIVSSTNHDLWELTTQGKFRRDLFFRLNVMSLSIPPLRERVEDISLLAETFLHEKTRFLGKNAVELAESTLEILLHHHFYGNVRELHNILEHSLVLCKGGQLLPEHLPDYVFKANQSALAARKNEENVRLRAVLERCGGNRNEAACILGMHRSTLWRKLRRLGLETQ